MHTMAVLQGAPNRCVKWGHSEWRCVMCNHQGGRGGCTQRCKIGEHAGSGRWLGRRTDRWQERRTGRRQDRRVRPVVVTCTSRKWWMVVDLIRSCARRDQSHRDTCQRYVVEVAQSPRGAHRFPSSSNFTTHMVGDDVTASYVKGLILRI
jgi:hypothetical protein